MDKRLLELFLYELKEQCNFAILAYKDFTDAYNSKNTNKLWMSLELFLIASAKISVIFWPQKNKYEKRGEELRNLLTINDAVAFNSRVPRNHLQHFDERLEEWFAGSQLHNLADKIIIPETTFIQGNIDFLRTFLSRRHVFKFLNDEYEIDQIAKSIFDLLPKVEEELAKIRGFH